MADMIMAREAYGETLVELGKTNERIVVFDADLSSSTKTSKFAKAFPERFFNCGIAEQNMLCVAAGFSAMGKISFVSTFSIFGTGRAWEQVRNTVAAAKANVKLVTTHGGISVGEDGLSHQSLEDIALMRVIPNMIVIVPADAPETVAAVKAAVEYEGPVFIRLGRPKVPSIWKGDKFEIGKSSVVREGGDVTISACGIMVNEALAAAGELAKDGISVEVINSSSVKPLDVETLLNSVRKTKAVVTCEEHNVIGGLGSAVAEVLAREYPVPQVFVGTQDRFGQSGDPKALMEEYGLSYPHIVKAVKEVLNKK